MRLLRSRLYEQKRIVEQERRESIRREQVFPIISHTLSLTLSFSPRFLSLSVSVPLFLRTYYYLSLSIYRSSSIYLSSTSLPSSSSCLLFSVPLSPVVSLLLDHGEASLQLYAYVGRMFFHSVVDRGAGRWGRGSGVSASERTIFRRTASPITAWVYPSSGLSRCSRENCWATLWRLWRNRRE